MLGNRSSARSKDEIDVLSSRLLSFQVSHRLLFVKKCCHAGMNRQSNRQARGKDR